MCQSPGARPYRLRNTREGLDRDLRSPQFIARRSVIWNSEGRCVLFDLGPCLSCGTKQQLLAHRPTERLAPSRRQRRAAERAVELPRQSTVALLDEYSAVEGSDLGGLVSVPQQRAANQLDVKCSGLHRF